MSEKGACQDGEPLYMRILIADDAQITRRSTRLMMSQIPGAEVVAFAHDGPQTIEMALEHRPDIAIIDLHMPELDGLEALQEIRREMPEMACILISGERTPQMLQRAMIAGTQEFLTKPFTREELTEAVCRVGRMVMSRRKRVENVERIRKQRDVFLLELANEYIKARRTDRKAMLILEQLANDPDCEFHLLQSLAVVYVFRREWRKLQALARRLELHSDELNPMIGEELPSLPDEVGE